MNGLRRELGLTDAVLLVVGNMIGAGIFLTPNLVAQKAPSGPYILGAWLLGGLLTLFGALAVAELSGMFPETGGFYVYLREAFGPLWGFLAGWMTFLILYAGGIAWMSVSFSIYAQQFLTLSPWEAKGLSAALIAVFATINVRGLRAGARTQDALSVLKVLGILLIVGAAFALRSTPPTPAAEASVPLPAFGVSLIACLLTYDGWITLSFVSGEVRDPRRNVPRALALGIGLVVALYLLANAAYLHVMSPAEIAGSGRVAADATGRVLGQAGASAVAVLTLLSIAGSVNGLLLSTPRLYYAMAADGLFFRSLARIHPQYGTPATAIVVKAAWAALLVVTGTYESLGSFAMFSAYIFYVLTAVAVIVLRIRRPDAQRPFRMWGYPLTTAAFIAVGSAFVLNTLVETPGPALAGLALIAAGVPAYWMWRKGVQNG